MGCLICEQIEQIQKGDDPYFVCELETGYVVLDAYQRFAVIPCFCASGMKPSGTCSPGITA